MQEKKFKRVCKCENCGNEAEMMITCSLESVESKPAAPPSDPKPATGSGKKKTRGHAVCSHCGGEADIWLDV
jgi:transcription elongation factor Elf1